jgi:hypothetical protein
MYLQSWIAKLSKRGRMHLVNAKKMQKYDTAIAIPTMLCGTACSSIQVLLTSSSTNNNNDGSSDSSSSIHIQQITRNKLQIVCVVLSSVMVFSTMMSRHLAFAVNADRNWQAGVGFVSLANDIEAQLVLPVNSREMVGTFLQRTLTQRASLLQQEPDLPEDMIEGGF